jgi:spermidine/putrescine ABC transporter ATP-binding subunit
MSFLSTPIGTPAVRLIRVSKTFGSVHAVRKVSFEIPRGAYICLLGPSGCGKTTILRSIAGFHIPDAGKIEISGRDMTSVPPNRRALGMVYQNYALFPHLTVAENIAFGLKMRGVARAELNERVHRVLGLVHLEDLGQRRPKELSGGQQQRVALARAIVIEPEVLLLDEPLSNLDAKLRKHMQLELKALQRRIGLTTIHVTHDQEEALTLADSVIILNKGEIVQIGEPRGVYAKPSSVFVADFLGRANFLPGRASLGGKGHIVETDQGEMFSSTMPTRVQDQDGCTAFIRPERVIMAPENGAPASNSVPGKVTDMVFSGSLVSLVVDIGSGRHINVERQSGGVEDVSVGTTVRLTLPPDALLILPRE